MKLPADIVGKDEATVTSILQSLGLQGKRETADQQDRARPAPCMSVSPGVGQSIRRGSFVSYKVSTGPKLVAVPQVTRASAGAAVDELEGRGFTVAVVYVAAACDLSRQGGLAGPERGHRARGVDGHAERRQVVSLPG